MLFWIVAPNANAAPPAPAALPQTPSWPVLLAALRGLLAGIGQIYFEPAPLFGAVMLACLYLARPELALGCVLGVCAASATSLLAGLDAAQRRQGLHSYNGALSGIGLCALYRCNGALIAAVLLAGALATLLSAWLVRLSACHSRVRGGARAALPVLTAPFVLIMWLMAWLSRLSTDASMFSGPASRLEPLLSTSAATGAPEFLPYLATSIGQAVFVGAVPLCAALWAALASGYWRRGLWMLAGASLAWLVLTGLPLMDHTGPASAGVAASLQSNAVGIGVNAALAALALTVLAQRWPWRLLGAALAVALCMAGAVLGLAYFTLPFVLASWLVLLANRGQPASPATSTSTSISTSASASPPSPA